jgi:hypothetical protein
MEREGMLLEKREDGRQREFGFIEPWQNDRSLIFSIKILELKKLLLFKY